MFYGDKQYVFTGLVRCGCCDSLMTCETRTKPSGKSYVYLKCNSLRGKCNQKPINEKDLVEQLEKDMSFNINISDSMLIDLKRDIRERLTKENELQQNHKKDLLKQIEELRELDKLLFKYFLEHKCDEGTFNDNKTEIQVKTSKLEKEIEKYDENITEIENSIYNIIYIVLNAGTW